MGMVYLVGGGPGDPKLITWKGLEVIRSANCIIYDRLIHPALLKEADATCEFIYVGKESHFHTMKQEEIQALLVEKAQKYERVVRLKGGDPYVFGRGGEEGIYLYEKGIPFEVIPGISSCIAGLAYAGIPISHRGVARGFRVMTAHDKEDELAKLDFPSLAATKETCVFLMGLSNLDRLMSRLIEAGKDRETKAAVISHATDPEQKTVVGTIEKIADLAKKAKLTSPALIVVGEVVGLRKQLNFWEEKPLFGRHYLLPRIGEEESPLAKQLRFYGAGVDEISIGKIQIMAEKMESFLPENYQWIVLTSKNGVKAFWEGMKIYRIDFRRLANVRFAVVGKSTQESLASLGIYADLVPERYEGEALAQELLDKIKAKEKVCIIRAESVGTDLRQHLDQSCMVTELVLYRNEKTEAIEEKKWQKINSAQYDGVIFTCASAAWRISEKLDKKENAGLLKPEGILISIGRKTSEALKACFNQEFLQAEEASYDGIVRTLLQEQGK